MVSIGGKTLIVHHLEKLAKAGFRDVVINLGHLGAKIPEALGDGSSWGLSIAYSDEGPEPLETGGGLTKALPLLEMSLSRWSMGMSGATLIFQPFPRHYLREIWPHSILFPSLIGVNGEISHFTVPGGGNRFPEFLYAGIAIYHPNILEGAKVEKFSIVPRLKDAISRNLTGGILFDGEWDDVAPPNAKWFTGSARSLERLF